MDGGDILMTINNLYRLRINRALHNVSSAKVWCWIYQTWINSLMLPVKSQERAIASWQVCTFAR